MPGGGLFGGLGISDHLLTLMHGTRRNLPRVRVTELNRRQNGSNEVQEMSAEIFFIDSYPDIPDSSVTLMGLRSQRLFMQGERVLAILLNMVRSTYGKQGIFLLRFLNKYICSGLYCRKIRTLDGVLADFYFRYHEKKDSHSVMEVQFRINCILAALAHLYPALSAGSVGFGDISVYRFEKHLSFLVRYALSEMCCYYRYRCM